MRTDIVRREGFGGEREERMTYLDCCNCCKSSKDSTLELRRTGEGTTCCFCCKSSSKVEGKERNRGACGIGCFLICESTAKEINSPGTKRCCCFPCKRSSEEDEKCKGVKNKCCFHCFRPCKAGSSKKGKGGTCNCFSCCLDRSKEKDSSNKGKGSSWCCFHSDSGRSTKVSGKEKKERSTSKSKEKSSTKRGKRVMCCCGSCCSRTLEERRPTTSRCEKILRCFCCINTGNGNAAMKKREQGFGLCCHSKQKEEKGNHLAALVHNMSFNSDSGRKNRLAAEEILRLGNGNIASRVFTYKELLVATNNFRNDCLLGSGGFGRVYKGQLLGTNEVIAVKQLDRNGYQGSREFLIEVLMLGLLHHPNLVKLLGYCAEGDQRILVYEYMPFGSLHDHLLDILPNKNPLDWATRMKIAFGAAKGLEHLHDVANPPVIYRDMKASNILLDENYNPKLSDFGLAKLGPVGDKTHVSTRVMGTYGYCAPEYALTGQLTKMSDVYSYGVLLLELITGRKAIDITRRKDEQHLVNWAAPLFKDKKRFIGMADPLLNGNFPMKGLYQALSVANMCLQHEASTRPLISDVVTAIEHLANPRPVLPEIFGEPIPQQLSSSDHERTSSEIFSFDEGKDESLRSTNMSFSEEKHERVGSTNMSFDEGNHERTRTANFLSFDEETFQSLSSDTESLREEDI